MIVIGSWICAAVAVIMAAVETWALQQGRLERSRARWWLIAAAIWFGLAL